MGKNIKRKTNVKSSIMVLLLIAILLIASTYAWFTSNQTVTISSIDVNVAASKGIQISVDGIDWRTVISNEDITNAVNTYAAAVNKLPTTMEPVSTIGEVANDRMKMFYGTVTANTTGDYVLYADAENANTEDAETAVTAGKYIAFDIFLKVDEAQQHIYLTSGSDVTHKAVNGSLDKGLKNSARVAFCILGNTSSDSTTQVIQGLTGGTDSYIWEPNYDVHTQAGVNAAYTFYNISTSTTNGSLIPYNGVKAEIPSANPVALASNSSDYFDAVTVDYSTVAGGSRAYDTEIFPLSAGITKIRVYMWVEGQDVDCENGASGADIRFDLGFTIDPTLPESEPEP